MITTPTPRTVAEIYYSRCGSVIRADEITDREPAYILTMWDDGYSEITTYHPCESMRRTVVDVDLIMLVQTAISRHQARAA